MSKTSPIPALKAALKEWGLPISGSKPDLWARLQDQVGGCTGVAVAHAREAFDPKLSRVQGDRCHLRWRTARWARTAAL